MTTVNPLDRVDDYVASFGVGSRPLREALAALADGPRTLDSLISRHALSRRVVEGLLEAAGGDVQRGPGGMRLRPDRAGAYRERFRLEELRANQLADPLDEALNRSPALLARMREFAASSPAPVRSLDHVAATPETRARRALWLGARFDLSGRRVLCAGDSDLTSLALCAFDPSVAVTVVDIDERVLAHIDEVAGEHRWDVRCRYADLRHGLPACAHHWADLVFTDPPYTPEGVQLFLLRGLRGLRDRDSGRVVLAYGFSESHPALGLRTQRALQRLHLAYEAMLPSFNRYEGAQAIGSASDLYVCRPTARTWRMPDRVTGTAAAHLYTSGPQAREAAAWTPDFQSANAVHRYASGPDRLPVTALVSGYGQDSWPRAWHDAGSLRLDLSELITAGVTASAARDRGAAVADLSGDPGPWLLRVLLALLAPAGNVVRVAALVRNSHPDVSSETGQQALYGLLGGAYALRFHRSTPTSQRAVVVADRRDPDRLERATAVAAYVLSRAHGKLGNVWREALVRLSRDAGTGSLTKNQARAAARAACRDRSMLDARLVDLPRHRIRELLGDVATSAEALRSPNADPAAGGVRPPPYPDAHQ